MSKKSRTKHKEIAEKLLSLRCPTSGWGGSYDVYKRALEMGYTETESRQVRRAARRILRSWVEGLTRD